MRTPALFTPITFRDVTLPNRIVVSPMCQYSAHDGVGTDWHIQNLGAKAMGGAGLVFTEATHVSAAARITPGCLGLWTDEQLTFIKRLTALIEFAGGVPGIQVAHAGRKASSQRPWEGGKALLPDHGGWIPDAISAIPFHDNAITPHAMTTEELHGVAEGFAHTAKLALEAGFKVLEVHGAHGYLIHSALSPIGNRRNDGYGGDLAGRARLLMETLDAVRAVWPANLPLFVRLSCSDYAEGGLTLDDTVTLARWLKARGDVDLIDCSGGGIMPTVHVPSLHPGYQVPFAERIRADAGIATGAVGLIRSPEHATEIVANGRADLVFLARALLADPAWPLRAATALGVKPHLPPQYERSVV
jgi:2,4-dienoyl-CoA reductase-like NADH-dependent reductase (Old Yellow Enzyme family)